MEFTHIPAFLSSEDRNIVRVMNKNKDPATENGMVAFFDSGVLSF